MGEKEDEPSGLEPQHVLGSTFDNSERLLQAFSQASAIGFAILDDQLRYQGINHCLANINGIPAEAHLGFGVRELFGSCQKRTQSLATIEYWSLVKPHSLRLRTLCCPTDPNLVTGV
jgi:hypothetical protein